MDRSVVSKEQLQDAFNRSFSRETSGLPELWTPVWPARAHCVYASIVAQELRGGELYYKEVPDEFVEYLNFKSHMFLITPGGEVEDYTRQQFPVWFNYDHFMSGRYAASSQNYSALREWFLEGDNNIKNKQRVALLRSKVHSQLGVGGEAPFLRVLQQGVRTLVAKYPRLSPNGLLGL